MNTVIPVSDDRIAGHFTKAESFLFIDPQGQKISTYANPAFNNHDCSAKKGIFELFEANQVKRVIVRNIGQRSLTKLLANEIQVLKSEVNYIDHTILLDDTHSYMTPLTRTEQGRPSVNYEDKKAKGGCNHDSSKPHGTRCCDKPGAKGQRKGKCCH